MGAKIGLRTNTEAADRFDLLCTLAYSLPDAARSKPLTLKTASNACHDVCLWPFMPYSNAYVWLSLLWGCVCDVGSSKDRSGRRPRQAAQLTCVDPRFCCAAASRQRAQRVTPNATVICVFGCPWSGVVGVLSMTCVCAAAAAVFEEDFGESPRASRLSPNHLSLSCKMSYKLGV